MGDSHMLPSTHRLLTSGGEAEYPRRRVVRRDEADEAARKGAQRRDPLREEGLFLGQPLLYQDGKITHLCGVCMWCVGVCRCV